MHSIFVSDLHLDPERPQASRLFFQFIEGPATGAGALYILGDLFESWVGDDDLDDPLYAPVAARTKAVSHGESGCLASVNHRPGAMCLRKRM